VPEGIEWVCAPKGFAATKGAGPFWVFKGLEPIPGPKLFNGTGIRWPPCVSMVLELTVKEKTPLVPTFRARVVDPLIAIRSIGLPETDVNADHPDGIGLEGGLLVLSNIKMVPAGRPEAAVFNDPISP